MPYLKMRFINDTGIVGWAIDWVTISLWDHVELETETGTWIGAHASGGVQERPANYCTPSRERRYAIPVTQAQYNACWASARASLGTKYDFLACTGIALHDSSLTSLHHAICSGVVLRTALDGKVDMLNVLPGWEYRVTPEALHMSPLLIGRSTYSFNV